MRLRYGIMCDYATSGAFGKPTIIGGYDLFLAPRDKPIETSPCFLHSAIDAPTAAGPRHEVIHTLIDGDGRNIFASGNVVTFVQRMINPSSQFVYIYAFVPPINLPDIGDYEWVIHVDGTRIGIIPFSVGYFPDQPPTP